MADAISAFVKFEAAGDAICKTSKGESRHTAYPASDGWLELKELSWSIVAETSFMEGGGAAAGKATPENLTFKHAFDMAAPPILGFIASGSHFTKITFHVCKATGSNKTSPYLKVTLGMAFIVKATIDVGADGKAEQSVEAVFKTIDIEYLKQQDSGQLGPDGAKMSWDILTTKKAASQ